MEKNSLLGHAGLSERQLAEWRRAFTLIDKDKSGTISLKELRILLTSIGHQVTDKQLQDMVASIDLDNDGTVDFHEFIVMMSTNLESKEMENEMLEAFKTFDKDGNGFITKQELREVMHSMGDVLTDDELNAMIRKADIDKDGQVNFKEFAMLMKQQ